MDPSFDAIHTTLREAGLVRVRPTRTSLALTDVSFSGRLKTGRRAQVSFAKEGSLSLVRLGVAADDAPRFAVTREHLGPWLAKLIGGEHVTAEVERGLEPGLHVETTEPGRLLRALGDGLRVATAALFEDQARSLQLEDGNLAVLIPYFALEAARYSSVLGLLDKAARAFDRTPIRVRILGGDRRALSAGGRTRCAYCHANLSGDEDGLVACECCATVLHDSCWGEHGHCPILGCEGKVPERSKSSGPGLSGP